MLSPIPSGSDSVGLDEQMRTYTSNKFLGDAARLDTALWEPLN